MELFGLVIMLLGGFFLYSQIADLRNKLDRLRAEFLSGRVRASMVEESVPAMDFIKTRPLMAIPQAQVNQSYEKPTPNRFYTWLHEDILVKVGALLLILALAWFVSYAFANNWIGPVGRIMLGLLLGISVLAFGSHRIRTNSSQGAIFTVLGLITIIMTTSAAQYLYNMFPPAVALIVMFFAVAYVTFVSLQFERSTLAVAGLLAALVAPFLVNVSVYDPLLLMTYLLLIVLGTLWVVWYLRVPSLTLLALFGVIVYTPFAYDIDSGVALLFGFVFTGIFFVTNIISLIRRYTKWVSPVHVTTAIVTGIYLISTIEFASPEEWVSTYLVFWSLIFAYGSFQVYIRTLNRIPFYIYAGVSCLLLGAATAAEFKGAVLTILITLEVLLAVVLLSKLQNNRSIINIATALFCIPGLLTLEHMNSYLWLDGFLHADFFALVIFSGALVLSGMARGDSAALQNDNANPESLLEGGQKILYLVSGFYVASLVWLVLHSVFSSMVATMLAMIIYSVVGLVLYITGRVEGDKSLKSIGTVILALVVIRLLLVDVWALELVGRIITFVVIGLLFMSTAFLPKLQSPTKKETEG